MLTICPWLHLSNFRAYSCGASVCAVKKCSSFSAGMKIRGWFINSSCARQGAVRYWQSRRKLRQERSLPQEKLSHFFELRWYKNLEDVAVWQTLLATKACLPPAVLGTFPLFSACLVFLWSRSTWMQTIQSSPSPDVFVLTSSPKVFFLFFFSFFAGEKPERKKPTWRPF